MSPAELRARLNELQLERLVAAETGLTGCERYMTNLEEEVAECLGALTIAMVTEMALLRREFWGPQNG